ncbi:MAG: NAD(P)/FAD-dependent oxidoreductase, partial [Rhizobiaceae bacterium]
MTDNSKQYDAIILGAGGAGLMCASVAGQRGQRVLLIDHADEVGKKILISGGGRCNFTNAGTSAANFISANPHFAKSALGRYSAQDFIDLVERYEIEWHEKTLGQLFCDGSAKQIVEMLLEECKKGDVTISLGNRIENVSHSDGNFTIEHGTHQASASSLVIATGGASIPKMGATDFAYDLARQFGLKVVEPRPALVPFTLGGDEALFKDLSGISSEIIVSCEKRSFREAALFTRKGLSGPAILQISSYWNNGETITIDFLPDRTGDWLVANKKRKPKSNLRTILSTALPERLVDALLERMGIDGTIGARMADMTDKQLKDIEQQLHDWKFKPNGTEGFAKAEVTVGGISTSELSSKTMETKKVPGLYVIGEAVDVT